MKYLIFFFFTFSLLSCQSSKLTTKKDFEVIKTTQEKWFGKGMLQGVYYKVFLNQMAKGDVQFDSIYVDSKWYRAIVEDQNPWIVMASKTKDITHSDQDSMVFGKKPIDQVTKIEIIKPSSGDNDFRGKNVLLYHMNGKKRYLELGQFKTLLQN